jgi:ABC-2 type transport system permease protein
MNTETATLAAAPLSAAAGHETRTTLVTLMRREFWEHRGLWLVPTIVAALLALATLVSVSFDFHGNRVPALGAQQQLMVLNMSQMMFALIIYVAAAFVVGFYALDCLYAERKDRSILFWKSLPVSDGMTVLSKFLVALVAVPLLVFVLALASQMLAFLIWELRVATGHAPDVVRWDALGWLRGVTVIFLITLLASLWYAPVIAASMLLSAWVKKNPLLWSVLGPVLLVMFEYIVFRTGYIASVIRYRSDALWKVLAPHNGQSPENLRILSDLNWADAFSFPNLWLGVVAAAALLWAAARVRRYRDDT